MRSDATLGRALRPRAVVIRLVTHARTHARRRGEQALRRLEHGDWPAPATVSALYGTLAAARLDAFDR
jgi:hypothetical protein